MKIAINHYHYNLIFKQNHNVIQNTNSIFSSTSVDRRVVTRYFGKQIKKFFLS